jgi:hypothetical protein
MVNLHKAKGTPDFCPLNSLIVDDQVNNAVRRPRCPSRTLY